MRLIVFCYLLLLGYTNTFGARILGVFPIPSISHQFFFQTIWRELSLRGHEVVVLATDPLKDSTLVNLTEIDISFMYDTEKSSLISEGMSKDLGMFSVLDGVFTFTHLVEKQCLHEVSELREMINNENERFDLIIVEGYFPMLYGLAYRFKAPIISALSLEPPIYVNDFYGIPSHPVFYPCILSLIEGEWNLGKTIKSTIFTFWQRFWNKFYILPRADREARRYFGDEMPYIETLMKNTSLVFVNRNLVFNRPRATVPTYIELNQMHIKPVKPLPKDLKEIMDNAKEGIVYFSLGSNVKSANISLETRKTIMGALSEIPYKVLWKFETDDLTNLPKNLLIRKWFPQQDVLAHPNVRAFITQGGIQSLEEAMSRGVPIIGLPFIADQPINIQRVVEKGMGLWADPATVTKDQLKSIITEVVKNEKYRKRVKEMHQLLVDQPMNSTEKIIWWTEYVLRHKGTSHLKSPLVDASFIQYYLVDAFLTIFVVPALLLYPLCRYFKFN